MLHRLRAARDERGVTAIEYGILASLIAVVIIASVSLMGGSLSGVFGNVATHISDTTPGSGGPGDGDNDQCNADGSYAGDMVWMKVQPTAPGYDPIWVNYPSGAEQALKSAVALFGTVELSGLPDRAQDGYQTAPFADMGVPACGNDSGPGGNGGSNPDCDGSTYLGSHTDWWYWRTDTYQNGYYFTSALGAEWRGNWVDGHYYWEEERGEFVSTTWFGSDQDDDALPGIRMSDPPSGDVQFFNPCTDSHVVG